MIIFETTNLDGAKKKYSGEVSLNGKRWSRVRRSPTAGLLRRRLRGGEYGLWGRESQDVSFLT